MTFKIAFLGDIVGTPGRQAVRQAVPYLRDKLGANVIIANAENADGSGSGLKPEQYKRLVEAGIDGITLGDHVFRKSQIHATLENEGNIIRPANLPDKALGRGWMRLAPKQDGLPNVYVITLLGRLFINLPADDPFATVDRILATLPEKKPIVLVEIHAEATSENVAMGWYLNGRVTAVVGTHTHVQTADEQVLPPLAIDVKGRPDSRGIRTGYITDLGMCGPHHSVIGRKVDSVLKNMTTAMHAPFDVATDGVRVCGVLLTVDPSTGSTTGIDRINLTAGMIDSMA